MATGWSLRRSEPRNGRPPLITLVVPPAAVGVGGLGRALPVKAAAGPNGRPLTLVSTSIAMVPSWQLRHAPETPDAITAPWSSTSLVELV